MRKVDRKCYIFLCVELNFLFTTVFTDSMSVMEDMFLVGGDDMCKNDMSL